MSNVRPGCEQATYADEAGTLVPFPSASVATRNRRVPAEPQMGGEDALSDEALMAAYCAGDPQAFDLLYSRHRGGLYRFLLRQSGAPALAEELFQDVWMGLIGARKRYVPQARFATFLYRIAHNRLVDHFRRSVHRQSISTPEGELDPVELLQADPSEQPDVRFLARAQIEQFGKLLVTLPSEQREAFVMHEEAGLSVEEIAAATGVSPETAKSRLRYAIAKLRRGLKEFV